MTTKLTTFLVGPPRTGKTCISNHLADLTESLGDRQYHPTQGVRILEFDRSIPVNGKAVEVACEVWDCSGDSRFHASWPALASSANAVIFVTSPDTRERDLDAWQNLFPALAPQQMAVFSHSYVGGGSGSSKGARFRPLSTSPLAKVAVLQTSLETDPDAIKKEFDVLQAASYSVYRESSEKEEAQLMA
ncbi:Intraflagellar transport protein 22 [Geranomyces variabilis]|uniref:Intraflagellar transport protein 22 n=1 Tax=Geranomyces variabilis TaxID=109894 RepID=A0AAD5XK44_9FUNG|nr:Intraflagellar transport protein 22 [Geranomyces variabilis]